MASKARVTLVLGDQEFRISTESKCTVGSLLQELSRVCGRDVSSCLLFRESAGRRRTVAMECVDPNISFNVEDGDSFVCHDKDDDGGPQKQQQQQARRLLVKVLVISCNKSVELHVDREISCRQLAEMCFQRATRLPLVASSSPVTLVRYRFPPDPQDAKEKDDWECLMDAKCIGDVPLDGCRLLCVERREWEAKNDASNDAQMSETRQWVMSLLRWENLADKHRMKSRFRAGLPDWARGDVWAIMLNAFTEKAESPGWYASLVGETPQTRAHVSARWEDDRKVVFRDVSRTFPNHPYFSQESQHGQLALQNVLLAWHSKEPTIGYCQGMNFLAALFLLHMDEETAFWSFHHLLKIRGLQNLYRTGMPLLHQALDVFQGLVEKHLPQLAAYFALNDIVLTSFASPWFHTLFTWRFPLGLVARIMDIFLREGFSIIFRVSLAVLKMHQTSLLDMDSGDALMFLQDPDRFLGTLSEDDWIGLALRIKKTRDMSTFGNSGGGGTLGGGGGGGSSSSSLALGRPLSEKMQPILQMARRVGSNFIMKANKGLEKGVYEYAETNGPEMLWAQRDEGVLLVVDGQVVAGTAEKLVERLSSPKFPGKQFTDTFLTTFRSFLTNIRLAQLLQSRLAHIPRPVGMSKPDFVAEIVEPISLRVFNILRMWMESYPRDFDTEAMQKESEAIAMLLGNSGHQTMADAIRRWLSNRPKPVRPHHPPSSGRSAELVLRLPSLVVDSNVWTTELVAKNLSVVDWRVYIGCQRNHLFECGSSVQSLLRWNAKLSSFVEHRILTVETRAAAVTQFQFFVSTATNCMHMNDFSGAMVISVALASVMGHFPKGKFLMKQPGVQQQWEYLKSLMDANLESTLSFLDRYNDQAAIPWFHRFSDAIAMVSAEEPETISLDPQRPGAINFRKKTRLFALIDSYTCFQKTDYEKHPPSSFAAVAPNDELTPQKFSDFVWSVPELTRQETQAAAVRLMKEEAVKWTSLRSPRSSAVATTTSSSSSSSSSSSISRSPQGSPRQGGAGGVVGEVSTPPVLGRRKSKADVEEK